MSEPGFMGAEGGDSGGQAESGFSGQQGQAPQQQGQSPANAQNQPTQGTPSPYPGFNPAWHGMLGKVPTQLHPIIRDDLAQFDRNYQNLAQQYAPFKQFGQQGITADQLQMGMNLVNLLDQNPQEFYRRLGEQIGIDFPPEEPQQQDMTSQFANFDETDPRDQQLQQMQQQMEQMQQMWEQSQQEQQYNQEVANTEQQLDQAIQQLQAQDPNFDVADVLRRVYSQLAMGNDIDLMGAYNEHKQYEQQMQQRFLQQQSPGYNAPKVVPTNGGMPPTAQNQQPRTADERVARAAAMIQAAQSG